MLGFQSFFFLVIFFEQAGEVIQSLRFPLLELVGAGAMLRGDMADGSFFFEDPEHDWAFCLAV